MATCLGHRDQHQASITEILKIWCNAGKIKLVIWEPTRLTKFTENYTKSLGWYYPGL